MHQPGIRRGHDVLGLDRGVDNHLLEIRRLGRPRAHGGGQTFLHQANESVLTHALAPPRH
jgi:hypothetical protein